MNKRVQFLLVSAGLIMTLVGCHGPMLGTVTETYVNQNDSSQTLELKTKETLKGLVAGRSPNPLGSYTLWNQDKTTSGEFLRVDNNYVLKSSENQEFKVALQSDSSLRDENGSIWKLQNRSHTFRADANLGPVLFERRLEHR